MLLKLLYLSVQRLGRVDLLTLRRSYIKIDEVFEVPFRSLRAVGG